MARTGFYPGSFDPVTYGHLDIIARAARLVDKLVLGVGTHPGKTPLLTVEQRVTLLDTVTRPIAEHTGVKISIETFGDLAVNAARRAHAGLIIRGLRDASDFDYEVQMGQMNGAMAPDIETVFLFVWALGAQPLTGFMLFTLFLFVFLLVLILLYVYNARLIEAVTE
jgi:pantetheine-phosphate adenylyltransferase